jgi:hypothetical protein
METTTMAKTSVRANALQGVKIYPNPVPKGAVLNVDFDAEKGEVACVLNLSGQILVCTTSRVVSIETLTAGIYFLTICDSHGYRKGVAKFVVE